MRVDKPWGWYKDLERESDLVIKKIHVKPLRKLSLQKHFKREEFWYIISGSGTVTVGNESLLANSGVTFFIEKGEVHRIEADANGITFVEVQRGECREDDIYRIEDDYGRADVKTTDP